MSSDAKTRYRVEHLTRYDYSAPVSQAWQHARLTPRALPWQRLHAHTLEIDPEPDEHHGHVDPFGNAVQAFALHGPHRRLDVRMRCEVDLSDRPITWAASDPGRDTVRSLADGALGWSWEQVRDAVASHPAWDDLHPLRFREPSTLVPLLGAARRYAADHLRRGRPWLEAVMSLMHAVHRDFEFQPGATTVATSVADVMQRRRGVCQDFAQVMLAMLRSHGLPARYVSGYLLTDPPPGQPRLMGADASHAWVAAFHPARGWVEFDPTNAQRADRRYVTLGWGCDYADVVPLRGVIVGGAEQVLTVEVSVTPLGVQAPTGAKAGEPPVGGRSPGTSPVDTRSPQAPRQV